MGRKIGMRCDRKISFSPPDISEIEIRNVTEVLRSGWITTGPKTKEFEKKIAEYCNTSRAVCLNSATSCMELTLRVLGIGEGDEVITTAYTYTASASVICHVGAKLVLADTRENSYQMDYESLTDKITEKTKAIISVDIAGVPCDYNKLFKIAEETRNRFVPKNSIQEAIGRIVILADSAHGFGAEYQGQKVGAVADFTSFSFHAVKNLTTAEGGAVTWKKIRGIDDETIYKEYMLLSLHGQSKDALAKNKLGEWEYDIVSAAYKCNMTDIMAAIGLGQLQRYEHILKKRKKYINRYDSDLSELNLDLVEHYTDVYSSSGHLYLVRLIGKDEKFRNEFIIKMAEQGIACNVHYKPLPMYTAYKRLGFSMADYPNAYMQFSSEVTLPLNTKMTEQDIEYVIDTIKELLG